MQGYGYPRPLVTKNNLLATMENKYPFLSLILDLLQNYPNMFEHTSNNLLYLMNLNISYKKQHIYDLFTFAMLSNPILSKKEVDSILSSPTKDEQYFLAIRRLLPMGYKYTYVYDCSMETLLNMCMQRYNHRLPEWKEFISIVFKEVPYLEYFYTILQNNN